MKSKKKSGSNGMDRQFAFGISRKGGSGAGSGYGKRGYQSVTMGEDEVEEAKSATGYELYHKDFSSAMQHAYDFAKSKGFVVDPKEIDDKVATGPKKPSSGKVNRYSLKAGRKKLKFKLQI